MVSNSVIGISITCRITWAMFSGERSVHQPQPMAFSSSQGVPRLAIAGVPTDKASVTIMPKFSKSLGTNRHDSRANCSYFSRPETKPRKVIFFSPSLLASPPQKGKRSPPNSWARPSVNGVSFPFLRLSIRVSNRGLTPMKRTTSSTSNSLAENYTLRFHTCQVQNDIPCF